MGNDLLAVFAPWRAKHARPAWTPVCADGGPLDGGQLGGAPRITPGEAWPVCGSCGAPMQHLLQLPTARVPRRIQGDGGWLQVFRCEGPGCPSWDPFGGANLARLIPGAAPIGAHPPGLAPLPARAIVGWTEVIDHPHDEDHEELGLTYTFDHLAGRMTATCPELGLVAYDVPYDDTPERIGSPATGDKLGGWPSWHMSAEYPDCPRCDRRMTYLLQLASEDGPGHVTQCEDHPDVLAFTPAHDG